MSGTPFPFSQNPDPLGCLGLGFLGVVANCEDAYRETHVGDLTRCKVA